MKHGLQHTMNDPNDDGSCIFLNVLGCAADINEDRFVNTADLLPLKAEFGSECAN